MNKILSLLLLLVLTGHAWAKDVQPPSLEVTMPKIQGLEHFLSEYEKSVRTEFEDDYDQAKAEGSIFQPWTLHVEGVLAYRGKFLAVAMQGYDYRGGAHGMPYMEVMYFDAKSKKALNQSDLLQADAYERLAQICRRELAQQGFEAHDDWMLKGTAPEVANYDLLVPGEDGLEIIFRSYQVAPYVAGTPAVMIPWSVAWDLFKEDYRP